MKKVLLSMAVVFSLLSCGGGKSYNQAVDEKFGYKDLKLESSFSEINSKVRNLVLINPEKQLYFVGDSTYYKYGDKEFSGITLQFYKGQLMLISALGYTNDMIDSFTEAYGEGNCVLENDCSWDGEKCSISVSPHGFMFNFSDYNYELIRPYFRNDIKNKEAGGLLYTCSWLYERIVNEDSGTSYYGFVEIVSKHLKELKDKEEEESEKTSTKKAGADL